MEKFDTGRIVYTERTAIFAQSREREREPEP